ncbi:MAG: 7-cyano-7-deazaguanine synthase [Fimbriimonadaceae bacterium]|nr:7-cyano-7-deazaguanine synthase [Fimbriimonadaceae bacterium]
MQSAVVLLSGGLDSATVLAMARDCGYVVHTLTIAYGQRHRIELEAAASVAASLAAASHVVVGVDLARIGGSALTDDNIAVPKDALTEGQIPATYVPARNTIMLSVALAHAEVVGANDIFIGVNAVDYSGYPDCRPEFVEAFERLANLATRVGVEGHRLRIHAPLINMTKSEIIREGLRLGVDYGMTCSCYDPSASGRPCGHCDACLIRLRAFSDLGMTDPAMANV